MYCQLQAAIQAKNGGEVRRIYRSIEKHPMLNILPDERRYIDEAMKVEGVERSLKLRDDRQAIKAARAFEQQGGNGLDELHSQLSRATRRFIRKCELEEVTAFIRSDRRTHSLVVSWCWPEEEQVRDALIIYSPYQLPPVFQEMQEVNYPYKYVIRKMHEQQEEIVLERRYTSLYLRICALMRDDWENPTSRSRSRQYKHYLSPGITGQAYILGNTASTGRSI